MCTHNQCFRTKIRKILYFFHLKIKFFTAVKYCCILHGRVCMMLVVFFFRIFYKKKFCFVVAIFDLV